VASLSQGRTAAAQCGLFTHKSVPVIFEPPCNYKGYIFEFKCSNTATVQIDKKKSYVKPTERKKK